ncbi:hypothetical protein HHI36_012974 [Cryptolaemus montrouzieri]|uniref:Uncharacterized protein n=1 Tax=Cryptolaemus montrouzieri TaxID=559131 RepID=A0ABD2NFU2_9CUCU
MVSRNIKVPSLVTIINYNEVPFLEIHRKHHVFNCIAELAGFGYNRSLKAKGEHMNKDYNLDSTRPVSLNSTLQICTLKSIDRLKDSDKDATIYAS